MLAAQYTAAQYTAAQSQPKVFFCLDFLSLV